MHSIINPKDPRDYQIVFQITFLLFGIYSLNWDIKFSFFIATLITTIGTQLLGNYIFKIPNTNWKSAIITALGLTLLLRTNSIYIVTLAGFIAIAAKFIFKTNGKHFINPANFAIVTTILITQQAWISPGQWGSAATLFFLVGTFGFIVLSKANRIDIALSFIGTLFILQLYRTIIYLKWPFDHLLHQFTNGSLLLFTFFMITDPASTPQNKYARIIWASSVAMLSFYLSNFKFIQGSPIWALVAMSFTTPIFNYIYSKVSSYWLLVNRQSINLP